MKAINKITSTFFCMLLCLSLSSCFDGHWAIKGEGPAVMEELSLMVFQDYYAVNAETYLSQGPQKDIKIEAQENILSNLMAIIKGKRLKISFNELALHYDAIKIWITVLEIQ